MTSIIGTIAQIIYQAMPEERRNTLSRDYYEDFIKDIAERLKEVDIEDLLDRMELL